MKTLTLRQAIIQRVRNKNDDELYQIIEDSVRSEERALPGLGVLFKIIWENSAEETKKQLVSTLNANVPN